MSENVPNTLHKWLNAEYQSPRGAEQTDGGLWNLPRRGDLGGTPGFQTLEMLESSSLGSGGKVGEGC